MMKKLVILVNGLSRVLLITHPEISERSLNGGANT
jgi:hypothetical protein